MDEQHSPVAGTPIYQESGGKNAKWLWILIALIIIGALVFAFWKGIGPFGKLRGTSVEATPTPSVNFEFSSPTPAATPGATIDKTKASIRVLNGSGKAGEASRARDFLDSKGYKVTSVGNATEGFDFPQTVIRLKAAFSDFGQALVSDLADRYSAKVDSQTLSSTDSADIEVVIGSK